jgi:hypothetical protein
MAVLTIVDVGDANKSSGEPLSHGWLADVASPPRIFASGRAQFAVIGEELHDRIEIMRIKRGE